MTTARNMALAAINANRALDDNLPLEKDQASCMYSYAWEILVQNIEAFEAFKQDVSEELDHLSTALSKSPDGDLNWRGDVLRKRFVIPKPVDPLSDALVEAIGIQPLDEREHKDLRQALAARGLKIVQES